MSRPVALIVGSSSGIGASLRTQLSHTHQVYGTSHSISGDNIVHLDLRRPASVEACMEELYHCLNGLKVDLLILNAGITAPSAIACSTDQQIDEIFQVNMIQQIRLLRHLVPLMNRRSRILQISSKSTLVALPFMGFYAASKAAFLSVMEALRLELQPQDIAVSSIILGNVSTDMWHKTIETFPSIIKHNSMYHGQITRAFDMARVKVREAMDVNDCAAKIIRIAIGRRIKPVYFIGADTLTFRLLRCIPYYVKEYLLKKQYGF